jgi:hypothetical protein
LATGAYLEAQQLCEEALSLDLPDSSYLASLTLGTALLYQQSLDASELFADTAKRCRSLLDRTPNLFRAHYAFAAALVGQAVCASLWAGEDERAELLALALSEYQRSLEICAAPGVVQDALWDLELIRSAGIEGLEPVFELLRAAEAKE